MRAPSTWVQIGPAPFPALTRSASTAGRTPSRFATPRAAGKASPGAPETLDRLFGLPVLIEPVLEGLSGVALFGEREREQRARDTKFVGGIKERKAQEGWRGVQRRRKRRRFHYRCAAAGFDECHFVVPADLVGDADAAVELHQIRAQAEEHVLAVVDDFSGAGMFP